MSPTEIRVSPDQLGDLPLGAGVYIFWGRRKEGQDPTVLYVGKSRKLRSRVRQYFSGSGDGRRFVQFIQKKTEEIRYILVSNEQEALVLENELIKKFKPPYNILLKDDKRYLSIRIDANHEWPKMEAVRKVKKDGAFYLGPFSSARHLRTTLDYMQRAFPLRTCTDHKLYNRSRPCLEYEIKRCSAPCVKYISPASYKDLVIGAIRFLKGDAMGVVHLLEEKMQEAAHTEHYEEAARLRDRIRSISSTVDGQQIVGHQNRSAELNQDVIGLAEANEKIVLVLLYVRHGLVLDKRVYEFNDTQLDQHSILTEFINRYYSAEQFIPDEVLVPLQLESSELEIDIPIICPRADEKRKFLSVAEENARAHLNAAIERAEKASKALTTLHKILGLKAYPRAIDCVDISHHQGSETVASVVRFYEGTPDKSHYRKIKLKNQVNDFDSMKEALGRRYKSSEDLPNLLVVDGGKGQLSSAVLILKELGWLEKIDICSLAKKRGDEPIDPLNPKNREKIFKPDQKNPLLLKEGSPEEYLLINLRDEAHRFAITFHRQRKVKSLSRSQLDGVPGLSPKMKISLLRKFKSLEEIVSASEEDLSLYLPLKVIKALKLHFAGAVSSEGAGDEGGDLR